MAERNPNHVRSLIAKLASEDSFERLRAIEELERLTQRTFGFRFNDPPEERQEAVRRWNDWWKEHQRRKGRRQQLQAAVQLSGGVIDLGAIKKAIEDIPAEKIQGYLNALITKMKSQQARCEACHQRPADVLVTEIAEGRPRTRHLCESCARERGEVF